MNVHAIPRRMLPGMTGRKLMSAAAVLSLFLLLAGTSQAGTVPGGTKWVATWGQAMTSNYKQVKGPGDKVEFDAYGHPVEQAPTLHDATLRQIVRTSIGGDHVRIHISNYFGRSPLTVSAAGIALAEHGHTWSFAIEPHSNRPLTFKGKPSITIAPGHEATSDPVALHVPNLSHLVVSLYFAGTVHLGDMHPMEHAATTAILTGNAVGAISLTGRRRLEDALGPHTAYHIYELDEVDVQAPRTTRGIVAIGDSITDGAYATAPDKTWPGVISTIANGLEGRTPAGVVNAGISADELTVDQNGNPAAGVSILERFERDVVDRAGVTDVIVLTGYNDINRGADPAGYPDGASAGAIIAGFRMLIDAAHEHHLRIYAGTMTPFAGFPLPGWYSPTKEAIRERVNRWIRTSAHFDGVIAFAHALRGRYKPAPMAARQTPLPPGMANICAGDQGLHPNDRGYQVMGVLAYDTLFNAAIKPAKTCH